MGGEGAKRSLRVQRMREGWMDIERKKTEETAIKPNWGGANGGGEQDWGSTGRGRSETGGT